MEMLKNHSAFARLNHPGPLGHPSRGGELSNPPCPDIAIVPAAPAHLPGLAEIAAAAPDPWSESGLAAALRADNQLLLAALQNGAPVGFACFLHVADTADLQQIVLVPALRGQGVGEGLLRRGLSLMQAAGATRCLLEVRCGNAPARRLYQKLGFAVLATRPGMYQNPAEDGLLMAVNL